jgi:putative flavoprotein involved in K+ transport
VITHLPRRKPGLTGTVDCIVIGAGHSGLAMSRCLTERSIDHLVLERGEVGNAWRHERWDSLRLLTPNWQTDLPGYRYEGSDPDGYMTMSEVVRFIDAYAELICAPVQTRTTVESVRAAGDGYEVVTDNGRWFCRAVVLASGAHNVPVIPGVSEAVPPSVTTVTAQQYRNPGQLDAGGVLVVGASATGVQLAHEIHRSGRPVTLAVGEHIRLPRLYRGRDIQWWLAATGLLDERYDAVDDIDRARRIPSPQLVGTPDRMTLDLNALAEEGVQLVGRLAGISGAKAQFSGSLRNHCAMADLKLGRLLATVDAWAEAHGLDAELESPERFAPTRVEDSPCLSLDLKDGRIRSIVWATGFRPDYSWLDVPVLDRKRRLRHDGGVVDAPGLYVMGLHFMRRRKSSFLHGAADDARELSAHLAGYLETCAGGPRWRAAG